MFAKGLFLQGLLSLIETVSLDGVFPGRLWRQPARYLAEGSFHTTALAGALQQTNPVAC